MNASKEEAAKALMNISLWCPKGPDAAKAKLAVLDFLAAAQRKLPTEASYKRAAQKRHKIAQRVGE